MKARFRPILLLIIITLSFFYPFYTQGKLPIPADTIVGLYHPFRDLYANEYPRGIPFKNSLITDPVRQQYPWRHNAILQEKNFKLPLWNPYNMAGSPLLANLQSAPFYPLNFIFLLPDFPIAWSLLIALQPLLAAICMFFYLKNLKLNQLSSLLGAFTFSFCGFSIAWLEWGTIGHVALWLPLILLSLDKIFYIIKNKKFQAGASLQLALKRSEAGYKPAPAKIKDNKLIAWSIIYLFSLTSAFFAGHLQTFFYLYIVSIVYFFAHWLQSRRIKKVLFLYLILNTLYLIIAFVQWLPSLQLIQLSARDIDQISFQKEGWFLPAQHLVQFIAPDFFGNPATLNYWGVWNYGEFIAYISIAPLIMAFFALFYRQDKKTFFFGSIFFLSLIFALPTWFAMIPFNLQIPFINTAQPTRLLFLTDFSLSILATLGLDYFMRSNQKVKIIYALAFLLFLYAALWIFVYSAPQIAPQISGENLSVARNNLYLPTTVFILTSITIIIALFIKKKIIFTIAICALIIITVFDLFRFAYKFSPFTNKEYLYPQTATLRFLEKSSRLSRIMTTDARILPPNFTAMYKLQSIDGYDPLYLKRYGELIAAMERNAPNIRPPFGFNRIINPQNYNSRIADLLGVEYVLSLNDISSPKLEKVFEEGQTKVYRNREVFNRAFFANRIISSQNKQQTINTIFDNKVDLRTTAVVENWDRSRNFFENKNNKAEVIDYQSNKIVIKTMTVYEGFLVLIDSYYPTWHAQICSINQTDCKETRIYLTDYNFRGVIVPAGSHTVIFYNTLL